MGGFGDFFLGKKGKFKEVSLLTKQQQPLQNQLINAGLGQGAGGAFGQSADYYRDLLSNNPQDMQSFAAPAMRQFNEDIIPGLSEQFAGMGAGGLSSSGFRNAAVNAGADLSERLGALRAQLRQQGAQGLQGIGQQGLKQTKENIYMPGSEGFLAPTLGALGTAAFGPLGGIVGSAAGNAFSNNNSFGASKVGQNSSPYGRGF